MTDPFRSHADSPQAPASDCYTVSPSDTAELPRVTKALYVGSAGDVALRALNSDTDVIFRNLPAGGMIDVRAKAVRESGTTAADLIALV